MYTLGVDIGTTSSKGVVLDHELRIAANARITHSVDYPEPGFAEQDAEVWWSDFREIIRQLSKEIDIKKIEAVGISSMCPTVLPVTQEGSPLRPAILYGIDSRALGEAEWLNKELGDLLAGGVYSRYSSQSILPKMMWYKNNDPEGFKRCAKFLTTAGYMVYRLTGKYTVNAFSASAGTLLDLNDISWFTAGLEKSGMNSSLLPDLMWPADNAGGITPEAAEKTGLPEGIPVTVGICDAAGDALVCGALKPGNAAVSLGGTTICVTCSDKVKNLDNMFVTTHLFPGSYIFGGATGSGGLLLEWFAKNVLNQSSAGMFAAMADVEYKPTSSVFLPYLNGARTPVNDGDARGLLSGLSMGTNLKDVYITLLESMAFDLADMVDETEKNGLPINQVRVSGGGTKNDLLLQVIAEVLERDITAVSGEYDAAAAAGILSRHTMGETCIEELVEIIPGRKIEYTGKHTEYLRKKRRLYSDIYKANRVYFKELTELTSEG